MSWVSKGLKNAERWVSSKIPHEHSADKRAERYALKEQMDLYKQQKDELHKASEELASQKKTEADLLHQKQIRALRRTLRRPSGFMGSSTDEVKTTLG